MIPIPFHNIDHTLIQSLIDNQTPENKTLEYKAKLNINNDKDKREFLADTTAFANTNGGHIIYGIQEQKDEEGRNTGKPHTANGLQNFNEGTETSRIENLLLTSVEPRIPGIQIKTIQQNPKDPILIIHIPQSWTAPHMTNHKNTTRFYARNNNGKYQMDIQQIRQAFAQSETLPQQIQTYRNNRITNITDGNTPTPTHTGPKAILHLIPITALTNTTTIDNQTLQQQAQTLQGMAYAGTDYRTNLDGILSYSRTARHSTAYTQLYRNGTIEGVGTDRVLGSLNEWKGVPGIASTIYEQTTIEALTRYQTILKANNTQTPIYLFLTLTNTKGIAMAPGRDLWPDDINDFIIDREPLLIPEVTIENLNDKPETILQPAFDMIWQASGHPNSPNYDQHGQWRSK